MWSMRRGRWTEPEARERVQALRGKRWLVNPKRERMRGRQSEKEQETVSAMWRTEVA
jgi:hypothetical protein